MKTFWTQVRELLEEHGFDSVNTPVVCGSALCAINGTNPEIGEQSIIKLMEAVDKHIEIPSRDTEGPFYFPVNRVVAVKGTDVHTEAHTIKLVCNVYRTLRTTTTQK